MGEPNAWGALAPYIVSVTVAAIGVLGVWISNRAQKGTRENALIDQLQEQLTAADKRSDKQDERMEKIEGKITVLQRVSRIRLEYIYLLRRHIDAGSPPPAPEWPPGIED